MTRLRFSLLAVFVVSFAVYSNTLFNGLVYDDHFQVVENPWLRDIGYLPEIFTENVWQFDEGRSNYYRPMMHTVYLFTYQLFGLSPWAFHLVNVLGNAGVCLVVFLLIFRLLGGSDASFPSLVAALLFAAHPVHTEVVAWVAGVPEISFTFFFLLSLLFYVRAETLRSPYYGLAVAAFFLATLCKETALILPVILVTHDYVFRGGKIRLLRPSRYAAFVVATGFYFLLRLSALQGVVPVMRHTELTAYQYAINALPLFGQYLAKLAVPTHLSAFHELHPILSLLTPRGLLSVAVALACGVLLFWSARRNRPVFFGLVLVFLPLAPALYIPGIGENAFAERYLYLPSVGFVLLVALWIAPLRKGRPQESPVLVAVLAGVFLLFAAGTVARNGVWKDEFSLWTDTVAKSPDSAFARNELGIVYASRGRLDDAVAEYEAALRLKPDHMKAHNNLGMAYIAQGRLDLGIRQYETALQVAMDPAGPGCGTVCMNVVNNLGVAYREKGLHHKAAEHLRAALELKPDRPELHVNLGHVYDDLGWTDQAMEEYAAAVRLAPDSAGAHMHLGVAHAERGSLDRAMQHLTTAVRLDPQDPDIHRNLAIAYRIQGRAAEAAEHERVAAALEVRE